MTNGGGSYNSATLWGEQKRKWLWKFDTPGRSRTYDLLLRRQALYPLSYGRACVKCEAKIARLRGRFPADTRVGRA